MRKKSLMIIVLSFLAIASFAQLKSPEEFLGYKIWYPLHAALEDSKLLPIRCPNQSISL